MSLWQEQIIVYIFFLYLQSTLNFHGIFVEQILPAEV